LAYPPLDEDGELLDGLGWQLAVREGRAPVELGRTSDVWNRVAVYLKEDDKR